MSTDNPLDGLFSGPAPLEATAEMRQGAATLFGLYSGYVEAGFTPAQSMQLLIALLTKR